MSQPIAIMDSGVGGLTVVQEVFRQLPREEVVYFGDTARCPYGPRDGDEVRRFSHEIVRFLNQFNPKMLVIACNTATAVVLEEMREQIPVPVIGVIHPGVRAAITSTLKGRIGVIGTIGTVQSKLYEEALHQLHPQLYVKSLACPQFVPIVESGRSDSDEALSIVRNALQPLRVEYIDTLILGCTHYPLLAPLIQQSMGEEVNLISSADETAREVSTILFHKNMLSQSFRLPAHRFFTSGSADMFKQIAQKWLDRSISVDHVHLDQLTYVD